MLGIRRLIACVLAGVTLPVWSSACQEQTKAQESRLQLKVGEGQRLSSVSVTVEPQFVGRTGAGGEIEFGGGDRQTIEIKPAVGVFIVFDVRVKAADAQAIGLFEPVLFDEAGKVYPPRFCGELGERSFTGGMIIDGVLKETRETPAIYRSDAAISLCFDVPQDARTLKLRVPGHADAVSIHLKPPAPESQPTTTRTSTNPAQKPDFPILIGWRSPPSASGSIDDAPDIVYRQVGQGPLGNVEIVIETPRSSAGTGIQGTGKQTGQELALHAGSRRCSSGDALELEKPSGVIHAKTWTRIIVTLRELAELKGSGAIRVALFRARTGKDLPTEQVSDWIEMRFVP